MNEALNQALILLAVGMLSVFAVLTLVVLTGKVLIRVTNKMVIAKPATISPNRLNKTAGPDQLSEGKLAAMAAVVDHLTKGKGQIQSVRKIVGEEEKDIRRSIK